MAAARTPAMVGRCLLGAYDVLLALRRPEADDVEAALNTIHKLVLASALGDPAKQTATEEEGRIFVKMQSRPEWNTSTVLLQWLGRSIEPLLRDDDEGDTTRFRATPMGSVARTLTMLQGLLHLHPPSQRLYARRANMELLLLLLPKVLMDPALDVLALPLLGLLLPTFLDSPYNTRLFESLGGLEVLVKAMKNRQARKEVRMMVVEIVWGWWMGEGGEGEMPQLDRASDDRAGPAAKARPRSMVEPSFTSASIDFASHHRQRRESDEQIQPPNPARYFDSPRARGRTDRKTVLNTDGPAEAPRMAQTPSRSRTVYFDAPVVEPKDVPMPETPASQRHLWNGPESALPTSASVARLSARRPSVDQDPAARLGRMLESTAKAFVPTTPHHSKSPSKRKLAGGGDLGWGTPNGSHPMAELDSTGAQAPPPKLLFPSPPPADISPSERPAQRSSADSTTPQRLLRHKKSASLGSFQFAHRNSPHLSPAAITPSPSSNRLAASAAPMARAKSADVRPSPSMHALPSSSSSKLSRRHSQHHRPSSSTDFAVPAIPRSGSRYALTAAGGGDADDGVGVGVGVSAVDGTPKKVTIVAPQPGTPMRSAAGRALAASLVGADGLPPSLPSFTSLKDRAQQDEKENGTAQQQQRKQTDKRTNKRQSLLGQAIVEEEEEAAASSPLMAGWAPAEEVKRSKLGVHMSNVDQLVRRFKEMGDGLQLR